MSKRSSKSKKTPKAHSLKPTRLAFDWKPAILLCVLSFLLYSNTLNHEFAFDDSLVITENKITQKGFAGIGELASTDFFKGTYGEGEGEELAGGRYRPLSLILIAIQSQLFGEKKKGPDGRVLKDKDGDILYDYPASLGHWTNVLLYTLCILLLYHLLFLWFGQRKGLQAIPFVASLIFLLHPVHTEVVANIKSMDEILCAVFLFASLIAWHLWIKERKAQKYLILSGAFFMLSLLAKETPFTYIGIFPLIAWVLYKQTGKDIVKLSMPFWIVAFVYLVLRTSMVGLPQASVATTGIMDNPFASSDIGEKLATICLICWRYLLLLVAPITMRADYSFAHVPFASFSHPEALLGIVVYGGLIAMAWLGLKKKRLLTLFIILFLFPLFITTNLVFNIGATMGERFLFLPSLGFALAVAWLLAKYLKVERLDSLKHASIGGAILAVYCAFFAFSSFTRNKDWKNNDTLFTRDVETTPKSAKLQNYQGRILWAKWREGGKSDADRGLLERAKYHYDQSVEIYPMFAMSFYDLGLVNLYLKDGEAAITALKKALNLNRQHAKTHELMGQVYFRLLKDYPRAIKHLRYSIEKLDQKKAGSCQDLGIYYVSAGNKDSAVYYFKESLELEPNNIGGLKNAAALMNQLGRTQEAQEYTKRANALQAQKP